MTQLLKLTNYQMAKRNFHNLIASTAVFFILVGTAFAEAGGNLNTVNRKQDERDLASTPTKPLPAMVRTRKKTGFQIPVRQWLLADSSTPGMRGLRGWAKHVYGNYGSVPSQFDFSNA
jgi:hypothetical protein